MRTGSAGGSRISGFSGAPVVGASTAPITGGPPSSGTPRPLHTRPSQPCADRHAQRRAGEANPGALRVEPRGALQHLHDGEVAVDLQHDAVAVRLAAVHADADVLVPADAVAHPRTTSSGPRRPRDRRRTRRRPTRSWRGLPGASASSAARTTSRRDSTPATSADSVSSRARTSGPQSIVLEIEASTPRSTSARHRSCTTRTASTSAAPFSGEHTASLADSALCCSTASRSSRPASRTIRSAPGSEPTPTRSASAASRSASATRDRTRPRRRAQSGVAARGVPGAHRRRVPGERRRPRHRRVVAGVGEVAVQRPDAADEALGVGGDRLGDVPAGRGDGADDGDGPLPPAEGVARGRPARRRRPAPSRGSPGSPPRPAARRSARRTRAAPPPTGRSSRR